MPVDPRSNRLTYLVQVIAGTVYRHAQDGTVWVAPTNNADTTPALDAGAQTIFAAVNGQKMFFADGNDSAKFRYYDPIEDTVEDWVATSGDLPIGEDNDNTPRLICTWRGRTVLSGLIEDPQNWFMSRVNDPFDYDYGPATVTVGQPIAGNNAPQGYIGDTVVAIAPFSDDRLIFFGDHSIYIMNGDPMIGGSIGLVTNKVGGCFGQTYCMGPDGTIYFVSDHSGIFAMPPGQLPQRISQPIDPIIGRISVGDKVISLNWDHTYQGFHVYITPTTQGTATHFMWEQRTGAWQQEEFAKTYMNPLACCMWDNEPIVGCWDGYVRGYSSQALGDDGYDTTDGPNSPTLHPGFSFDSYVVIGPLTTKDLDEIMLYELQAVLGEESSDVSYEVYVADTAESALYTDPVDSGTWTAGRNSLSPVRSSGYAVYVKLLSSSRWQMEQIRARWGPLGAVRRRGA